MKLDDLISWLGSEIVQPRIDANSPGEMVRSSLAGVMPGQAPRAPMPMSGAPAMPVQRSAMAPPNGRSVDVMRYEDNPDGTTTNFLSDGSKSVVNYSNAGPGRLNATEVGGTPSPQVNRPPPTSFLANFAAGAERGGGILTALSNAFDGPAKERYAQEQAARVEQQTRDLQNQTIQFLVSKKGMDPTQAALIARDPKALQEYLKPQEVQQPKYERVGDRLVQIGPDGVKEVYAAPQSAVGIDALTKGAPNGTMWVDPADPRKGVKPIPGAEKITDPKEYQTKDAMFAERLMRTNSVVEKVMAGDPASGKKGYDPTRSANAWAPDTGVVASMINSDEWKQYQQAAREGIAAILRKDTGAAVTEAEWDLYWPMLYPQPGDDPQTVEQKRQARQAAEQALKGSSGPAFDKMFPNGPIGSQPAPVVAPQASGARPVTITGDDHYNQLPPGTRFIDPEGNERVKP
jgi:hypothetical protein